MLTPARVDCCVSLLCLLIASSAPGAQSVSGNTLIGKVRRQTGQAVPNVLVQLETGNGVMITQTVTTNEGDYAFSGLEGASFVLIVNEPGHEPFRERVELTRSGTARPGETVRIDIVLTDKPRAAKPPPGTVFHQDVPDAALAAYRRGIKLVSEHKSDEGISALSNAIEVFPVYFDAHFALALEMVRLHRHDQAIAELEKARSVNPRDARLYQAFGMVLFEQKKFSIAAESFEAAARLDPGNADARLMRGAALIELGRLNEAEQELKAADRLSDRKLAMIHLHLARIYEKRGKNAQAADQLETYLRKSPSASNATAIREAIERLRATASSK